MFENLIGNEETKKVLNETIINKNIFHSYMFLGIEGVGKKLFAREYAKKIMCINDKQCKDNCDSCLKFNANSHPDFKEIVPDGKKIKIDQIRKIQESILEKPIISQKKVYIIDDADTITEEGQNCLLKTLEEPPEYVVIILITSNLNNMLPTIKSRCNIIKFNKILDDEIQKKFNNLTPKQIKLLRRKPKRYICNRRKRARI